MARLWVAGNERETPHTGVKEQETGGLRHVRLLRKRKGSTEPQTYKVNVHDIMSRGVLKHDLPLQPGDVIIVDRKLINF